MYQGLGRKCAHPYLKAQGPQSVVNKTGKDINVESFYEQIGHLGVNVINVLRARFSYKNAFFAPKFHTKAVFWV